MTPLAKGTNGQPGAPERRRAYSLEDGGTVLFRDDTFSLLTKACLFLAVVALIAFVLLCGSRFDVDLGNVYAGAKSMHAAAVEKASPCMSVVAASLFNMLDAGAPLAFEDVAGNATFGEKAFSYGVTAPVANL